MRGEGAGSPDPSVRRSPTTGCRGYSLPASPGGHQPRRHRQSSRLATKRLPSLRGVSSSSLRGVPSDCRPCVQDPGSKRKVFLHHLYKYLCLSLTHPSVRFSQKNRSTRLGLSEWLRDPGGYSPGSTQEENCELSLFLYKHQARPPRGDLHEERQGHE